MLGRIGCDNFFEREGQRQKAKTTNNAVKKVGEAVNDVVVGGSFSDDGVY